MLKGVPVKRRAEVLGMNEFDYSDNIYFFNEVSMDPVLMDGIFSTTESLHYQHEFFKKIPEKLRAGLLAFVKDSLTLLTDCQREALILYFFKGKKEQEIAFILQKHQTTISQHIRYGVKKLRKLIKQKFPEVEL